MTHTIEAPSSRHALLVILSAVALWLVAVIVAGLLGEWKLGLILGAAACVGRLTTARVWRR